VLDFVSMRSGIQQYSGAGILPNSIASDPCRLGQRPASLIAQNQNTVVLRRVSRATTC
jgi:hypothetical protein